MARFILVFSLLLAVTMYYVGSRLAENWAHILILVVSAVFILMLPMFHLQSWADKYPRCKNLQQQGSYLAMGLMSSLFVVAVMRDLIFLALLPFANGLATQFLDQTGGNRIFALAGLISVYGFWRALRGPHVREVTIPIDDLHVSLSGMRIVQISDLHIGPTIGQGYVERMISMVEVLKPDLTVLTGDIVDGHTSDLRLATAPLARLFPYGRVFFVPGNHEYYWNIESWVKEFRRLGANVLMNRGEFVKHNGQPFWVGGITDPAATQTRSGKPPDVALAFAGSEAAGFRLLLSHRPGVAVEAEAAGFHLQLSGHTHGGQFFPWTQLLKLIHRFFVGLMKHGRMWVYVSPGTGTWGPPLRIGTTPELTLIRLVTATEKSL